MRKPGATPLSTAGTKEVEATRRARRLFPITAVLIATAAVALSGCRVPASGHGSFRGQAPPQASEPRTLTVFAAASLTSAFKSLQAPFERQHPGWKIRYNFGASSTLRTQIEQGAPADVFAAADAAQVRPLVTAGRVEPPTIFARNHLVVVVPAANPGQVSSPKDLARPGLRIVTTAEAVPIGRYTRQALDKLATQPGYPAGFAAQVTRNVVSREANVRAVLTRVELGEADAAVVYASDARSASRVKVLPLPSSANIIAEYPIAVVTGTPQGPGAEAFIRLILSHEGRAVLLRNGFR